MSYNLIEKKWIPVLDFQGNLQNVGIKELFENAHTYSGISDESPLFECGMYRLCISIIMDAFRTDQEEPIIEFEDLWNLNSFSGNSWETLSKHLDEYHHRFDLFDPEKPFYQIPISNHEEGNERYVSDLLPNLPGGNNTMHYMHSKPENNAFSPAICARGLCTIPAFTYVGGAGYKVSVNGRPPWYFILQGKNLFRTLLLNCAWSEIPGNNGTDPPFWRSENYVSEETKVNTSTLGCLTWQPRKVTLIPDKGGICSYSGEMSEILVNRMLWSQGFSYEGFIWDPHTVLKTNVKKNETTAFFPFGGSHMWWDFSPKILVNKKDFGKESKILYEKPVIVEQFSKYREMGVIDTSHNLRVDVYGISYVPGKMKALTWYHEKEAISSDLLDVPNVGLKIQQMLDVVDYVENILVSAIETFYQKPKKKESKGKKTKKKKRERAKSLKESAISAYSYKTEQYFRNTGIPEFSQLGGSDSFDSFLRKWKVEIMKIGSEILTETIDSIDSNAEFLETQVESHRYYRNVIFSKYNLGVKN